MKTYEPAFSPVLLRLLHELEALEKSCKKAFLKIRNWADSPELAKALHDEQTGITDHIGRIKLIKKEIGKTSLKLATPHHTDFSLERNKNKGAESDLWLVARAQQLLQQKIALYKLAHRVASQLELPHSPVLLEQTTKENEATATWLDRIAQRILNDESITPIARI